MGVGTGAACCSLGRSRLPCSAQRLRDPSAAQATDSRWRWERFVGEDLRRGRLWISLSAGWCAGEDRGRFDFGAVVAAAAGEGLVVGDDGPGLRGLAQRRDPFRDDVVGGAAAAPDDLDAAEAGGHAGALGPVEDHHDLLALARPGEEGGEDRLASCAPPPLRPALRRDSRRRSARASGASHSLALHPIRHQILQTFSRTIG